MNPRHIFAAAACLAAFAFLLAALGSRNNAVPNSDEIYHLVAASSLLETGEPAFAEGVYRRAVLYTAYVGLGYALFGESLLTAELLSAAAFGLLIAAIVATLWRRLGAVTAVVCGLLVMLTPHSLELASTVRFYMPQALLFWVGAWCCYSIICEGRHRWQRSLLAFAALASAYHLQPTTAIGVAAIAGWALTVTAFRWLRRGPTLRRSVLVCGAVVGVAVTAFMVLPLEQLWTRYQTTALWNEGSRARYYYWVMTEHYNPFWGLFPMLALLAWYREPRIAGFSIAIFAGCFILLSFGGMREDRYIYFALPFFFLTIALGLRVTLELLIAQGQVIGNRLQISSSRRARALTASTAFGALLFLTAANLGYVTAAKNVVNGTTKREQPRWDAAAAAYHQELTSASILLTNSPNHVWYFFDRLAVGIGLNRLNDGTPTGAEFERDFRTGATLIGHADSLSHILDCVSDGYLIAEERQWRQNPHSGITAEIATVIEDRMERVETPEDWEIRLYRWSNPMQPLRCCTQ